jgi:hypothetical protein
MGITWAGRARAITLATVVLAACDDDDDSEPTATTTPVTETLTVRVTAEVVGFGCMQSPVFNDSRLTVDDQDGRVIGSGVFSLSPGLTEGVDTCDFTAEVKELRADAGFYVLDVDGDELVTLSRSEIERDDWSIRLHVSGSGEVQVT